MKSVDRRGFIKSSSTAVAALTAASYSRVKGANERIAVGVVGLRGRGRSHVAAYLNNKEAEVAALCDIDQAVLERAALESGASAALAAELAQPVPLPDIVTGVDDPGERATLYGLAFAVARADEQVGGAERIFLAQLAHLLRLGAAATARIEAAASTRIDNSTDSPA